MSSKNFNCCAIAFGAQPKPRIDITKWQTNVLEKRTKPIINGKQIEYKKIDPVFAYAAYAPHIEMWMMRIIKTNVQKKKSYEEHEQNIVILIILCPSNA